MKRRKMKNNWWKIAGVLILLYVFFVGLKAPLSPGIINVTPESVKTGQAFEMQVTGYNAHYTAAEEPIRAWLEIDSAHAICADMIKIVDETNLKIGFTIPNQLPDGRKIAPATLILNSDVDGSSVFPASLFISTDTSAILNAENRTTWNDCAVQNLFVNDQFDFPYRNILSETIRNLYFHVPLWFSMMIILLLSVIYSILYLKNKNTVNDIKARAFAEVGILYGILGTLTGGIWAEYTWGTFWSFDIKQNMTAVALLIYMAYFVLRNSFDDEDQKARIGAVYNIFAFSMLIPLLYIIPRIYSSLHPGNGGNPGFGGDDLDNTMRTVFYPAIIGWTLLGLWISNLVIRTSIIFAKKMDLLN